MAKIEDYYIGLDCGSASVGWAVTDENYNIPKLKGMRLWGSRLFDVAETAAERRVYRSSRRRYARAKNRIKLLNMLFSDEIAKVDPDFYTRLRESFYLLEDKRGLKTRTKNVLFDDDGYKDKDFHKEYPTIWHLRQAIISDPSQHFDIRQYYLAIRHILKRRGHFLYAGKFSIGNNFSEVFQDLVEQAERIGIYIDEGAAEDVEKIITDQEIKKLDKKKQLKDIMFLEREGDEDNTNKRMTDFAGMLVGSKVDYNSIFKLDGEEKASYSFAESTFEDKLETEIEQAIGVENIELVLAAKKVYDYAILKNLLGEETSISAAMVRNYNMHQKDLKKLKEALKPFKEDYDKFFKAEVYDEKSPSYNAYIGKAFSMKNDRKKTERVDQETINKFLAGLLGVHGISGKLLERAEKGELLPKQKGQAKGTIPQQLHHAELEKILEHLAKDYPSFAKEVAGEPEEYNNKCKKISQIHSFRIPYYCGPLVPEERSEFSWGDEEIKQIVYPWNFAQVVDLDARANKFIHRMTNECTYLVGEEVLPKNSLLYQKYLVLNELNNLKLNGKRITDVKMKQVIYEEAFRRGQLTGNVRLKGLKKWLVENGMIAEEDELGGTNDVKVLPKLSTHLDFAKTLGEDYQEKYSADKLEGAVEAITVLGEEREMLTRKILELLNCDEDTARKLAKVKYKDWGRLSGKFLAGITAPVNVVEMSILDALYETNNNLMELLGGEFGFTKKIEECNEHDADREARKITYTDVKNLYCSPAVKRTIWQAIRIVNELTKAIGRPPKKIFLEVTRENETDDAKLHNAKFRMRRKEQLLEAYLSMKNRPDELIDQLKNEEDRNLQSKKLYLYYMQGGRCAYSGERIEIEELQTRAYDIDHIYPRSLTKDDSITRNLVLVKAEYNREKTNTYPIDPAWQEKMRGTWRAWQIAGLITKEKYNRLVRTEPLTYEELGQFIARQLVETSQSVKAIGQLLNRQFPDSKIVTVKAGQVSDFRHMFARGKKDRESGRIERPEMPEFIKLRELNDYHHAKDAYLNIVVGNVTNSTFTDDPYRWVKDRGGKNYSIRPELLFRADEVYQKKDGIETRYPEVKGWEFQKSIDIISGTMKRNDVSWTRMTRIEAGQISDVQLVGKTAKVDGILPIRQSGRMDVKKYGGYNSIKGAYTTLIELENKHGEKERRLVQIPIVNRSDPEGYIRETYDGRIIIPIIPFMSLLKLDGFPLHLAGRTGNNLSFYHAVQVIFKDGETLKYIKRVSNVNKKLKASRGEYQIVEERDGVSKAGNQKLLESFLEKLEAFRKMPLFKSKIDEIKTCADKFVELEVGTQCVALGELLKIFGCNATNGDLTAFVPKSGRTGLCFSTNNLEKYNSAELICQSPTGLYEYKIDLKKVK